jgi:hypothetical protein
LILPVIVKDRIRVVVLAQHFKSAAPLSMGKMCLEGAVQYLLDLQGGVFMGKPAGPFVKFIA